ncbi:VanZ family protein [Methylomonas rosea]|uniref:VanZ family protein n=1 Tax=Methylomonas rosea TaxID=2952227 RepID=A0ABT1TY64_9GAMM|nr:VanZ family protein [Methylomonas sp. WSC-7]MCQ8119699.1 VanZ family protein [Methylomonas sp. WSC-7]
MLASKEMTKGSANLKLATLSIALSICLIAILFIESSRPPLEILGQVPGLDKAAHFLAFGVLALLLCMVSFSVRGNPYIPLFSTPSLIVILLGIAEEGYQMTVTGRVASLLDLMADICGAVFVIFLLNRSRLLNKLKILLS